VLLIVHSARERERVEKCMAHPNLLLAPARDTSHACMDELGALLLDRSKNTEPFLFCSTPPYTTHV
jgi:hypothetical protein